MSRLWLSTVFVLGFLALPRFGHVPFASDEFEPSATARVAPSSLPDTLRTSTDGASPLIVSLPAELQETPVTRYSVLQAPSLSGVADRSFTWIPRGTGPGTYDVRLQAHHSNAAPDTLVVQVTVES